MSGEGIVPARRYAHEIEPHPTGPTPLARQARYHIARAQGFYAGLLDLTVPGVDGSMPDAVRRFMPEMHVALLYFAMERRAVGESVSGLATLQDIADWVSFRLEQEDGQGDLLHAMARVHGIDVNEIRPYSFAASGATA